MGRKKRKNLIPDDLFLDDTPREWVNEKKDEFGLSVRHHYLICHLAIKARYFPDAQFPTTTDKCHQYHTDRNLQSIAVKPTTFYKSYSSFEYVKVRIKHENKRTEIIRRKYISYPLIEYVLPFIELWYPYALLYVQTLNSDPYRLDTPHYYWVYRELLAKYNQSMVDFVKNNCPHIDYNTFKSIHRRNYKNEIPSEIKAHITPYMEAYYPDALENDI